ncbi:SipW-dependent-type signal peptide-containing protein [Glutamicibacter arilaitensis]|uniref:SipW-dependent-type signal peptide-containing protein n=1 Tax=Glutamicibacter arilaitensis TaxID=256701 RepID=UPI003FD03546
MATASNQKSRKVKALLAGGLVLGVGAAVTLAAWTEQEWATGNFTAGSFNVQGSTDGAAWDENEIPGEAAAISFSLDPDGPNPAENLSPDTTVAGAFALRTAAGTTYDATVELLSSSATETTPGDSANLTYGIFIVDNMAACTEDAIPAAGNEVIANGTAFGSVSGATVINLAKGASTTETGAPVTLCFQVHAGAGLDEGQVNNATWQFEAASVE